MLCTGVAALPGDLPRVETTCGAEGGADELWGMSTALMRVGWPVRLHSGRLLGRCWCCSTPSALIAIAHCRDMFACLVSKHALSA